MTIKLIRFHVLMFVGKAMLGIGRGFARVAWACFHAAGRLYCNGGTIKRN